MKMVLEAWRGRKPLALVFWGYFVGLQISLIVLLTIVLPLFEPPSSGLGAITTTITFSVAIISFNVWLYVSLWRCAANSKPVYKIIARIFVVMSAIGITGRMTATGSEFYFKNIAVFDKNHNITERTSNIVGEWKQDQLNEKFMRSITKEACVKKTEISLENCRTKQCLITLGGVFGDCVVFGKGSRSAFCDRNQLEYLSAPCNESDRTYIKCSFFQMG